MHLHSLILLMLLWQEEEEKMKEKVQEEEEEAELFQRLCLHYVETLVCIDGLFTSGIVSEVK